MLKERVERLRRIHLKALAAFNAFEQMQEYRAPNIYGEEIAHRHAEALGMYKGFFNTVQNALNTELHISIAKLFDSHKDALHIEKLVNYAEQNQTVLTSAQKAELDEEADYAEELSDAYEGLSKGELLAIRSDLYNSQRVIARLKDIRDKEVAHINIKTPEVLGYLTYGELSDLISLSEKILNLVSKKIYGDIAIFDPYKDTVVGDSKALFELVDSTLFSSLSDK